MHCTARDTHRVIPGRHEDGCGTPDCPGCLPCPEPHCLTCRAQHADVTCPACLGMVRSTLVQIETLYDDLPHEAVNGRHAYHPHGLPGGDAVVLLVPGPSRAAYAAQRAAQGRLGADLWEYRHDPRPVLTVLGEWAALWREKTNAPTTLAPTIDRLASYLDAQLHHIAQDPDTFPGMARDLRKLLHTLEEVLYDGVRPELSRVPCLGCGTRLEKRYTDDPTKDHWRCPRCGETYDRGRYDRAKHDHLASTGAERYVAIADAAAAIGRPRSSVWNWVAKGIVEARRDPTRGTLVWWPQVREQHLEAQQRVRQAAERRAAQ